MEENMGKRNPARDGKMRFPWPLVWLVVLAALGYQFIGAQSRSIVPELLDEANRFYQAGQFPAALKLFEQAMAADSQFVLRLPGLREKLAYCYFQVGKYRKAWQRFQLPVSADPPLLADYQAYFAIRSLLALKDTTGSLVQLAEFTAHFPDSPLVPLVDSMRAELAFQLEQWQEARSLTKKLLRYRIFDPADLYVRLIDIDARLERWQTRKQNVLVVLKNYPFHPRARELYQDFLRRYGTQLTQAQVAALFRYLIRTRQFGEAEAFLATQWKHKRRNEQLRWYQIKLLYERGAYRKALEACLKQRRRFRSLRYLREVDLHIARCYLRLGEVEKSIQAYDRFQRRYPGDPLAAEVLWKIAWLCEELSDLSRARSYYERLAREYPHSAFVNESRFRAGMTYYRQKHYTRARMMWQQGPHDADSEIQQGRFRYWMAKSLIKENDLPGSLRILGSLATTPFESYYHLKSFLLTKNGGQIHHLVDSLLWELHHLQVSYLPEYLHQFERVLRIEEIFGKRLARYEMETAFSTLDDQNWPQWFALAELQERVENFGKAYRLFRRIYLRHFVDHPWSSWTFLFKRLYPLYFDQVVDHYARQRNLNPALVWAVIKKESAFEPRIVSYADAYGLMQIIPPTAREIARQLNISLTDLRQLFVPDLNIRMGTYYLQRLLQRYQGNLYYALAAYNAGPHRVDRWKEIFPTADDDLFMENIEFEQTRTYVRVTMRYYWTYYLLIFPDRLPEDLISFPERITHGPWYESPRTRMTY